jgi:HSP20 family molecular chaperone IbpA
MNYMMLIDYPTMSVAHSGYLLTMDIPGVAADAIDVAVHRRVSGEHQLSVRDRKLNLNERWRASSYVDVVCRSWLMMKILSPNLSRAY